MMKKIAATIATMGRSMKNLDMTYSCCTGLVPAPPDDDGTG